MLGRWGSKSVFSLFFFFFSTGEDSFQASKVSASIFGASEELLVVDVDPWARPALRPLLEVLRQEILAKRAEGLLTMGFVELVHAVQAYLSDLIAWNET